METFYTTFEGFCKNNIYKKEDSLKEQDQEQFTDEPPSDRAHPWHYTDIDQEEEEAVKVMTFEDHVKELKKDIAKAALYGQIAGSFLVSIINRYRNKISRKIWESILYNMEEQVFDNPDYYKIANAIAETELKLSGLTNKKKYKSAIRYKHD